jgi:hypothetical protein
LELLVRLWYWLRVGAISEYGKSILRKLQSATPRSISTMTHYEAAVIVEAGSDSDSRQNWKCKSVCSKVIMDYMLLNQLRQPGWTFRGVQMRSFQEYEAPGGGVTIRVWR